MMQPVKRLTVFLVFLLGLFSTGMVLAQSMAGQRYNLLFDQTLQKARTGDPDAEYALGYQYYYGQGSVRDEETGIAWIQKAAAQGQPQAIAAMKLLNKAAPAQRGRTALVDRQGTPKSPMRRKQRRVGTTKYALPERNLLQKPANRYTVQLVGASKVKNAQKFINRNHLNATAVMYHTYLRGNKRRPWHVVVYGDYATLPEAKAAIKRLPIKLRQQKPWVKTFAAVQKEIRIRQPTLGGVR